MITLELTKTMDEIKLLINRDDLGRDMALCEDISLYNPNIFTCSWFKIRENHETIGLFVLQALTDNCASFHGGIYKEYRHQHTVRILQSCLQIIHTILPYSLITYANEHNKAIIKVFQKAGLVYKTTIKHGYKTGDMLVFGEV